MYRCFFVMWSQKRLAKLTSFTNRFQLSVARQSCPTAAKLQPDTCLVGPRFTVTKSRDTRLCAIDPHKTLATLFAVSRGNIATAATGGYVTRTIQTYPAITIMKGTAVPKMHKFVAFLFKFFSQEDSLYVSVSTNENERVSFLVVLLLV